MIVIVAGDAPWPKVRATLDYFHQRDGYTGVLSDLGPAKRWALERGVKMTDADPLRVLNRLDYARVHVIGKAGSIAELARQRGRRVVETP